MWAYYTQCMQNGYIRLRACRRTNHGYAEPAQPLEYIVNYTYIRTCNQNNLYIIVMNELNDNDVKIIISNIVIMLNIVMMNKIYWTKQ